MGWHLLCGVLALSAVSACSSSSFYHLLGRPDDALQALQRERVECEQRYQNDTEKQRKYCDEPFSQRLKSWNVAIGGWGPTGWPMIDRKSYEKVWPRASELMRVPGVVGVSPGDLWIEVCTDNPAAVPLEFEGIAIRTLPAKAWPAGTIGGVLGGITVTPSPNIVAQAITPSGDGILNIPGTNGSAAFAVATTNVGGAGPITVLVQEGLTLPVTASVCQTDAQGQCLALPSRTVVLMVDAAATPTFSVFVQARNAIASDAINHRVFVSFKDAGNVIKGSTSVAVRTLL